jgi:hypothetical protein
MPELLVQRTPHQCAIATLAMATGRDYAEVLAAGLKCGGFVEGEGTRHEQRILVELGFDYSFEDGFPIGDFVCWHRGFEISAEGFRQRAWGRRAIMSVPSLNQEGGSHSIYWTGRDVLDPNPPERKRYSKWAELLPTELILFREGEDR